MSKLRVMHDGLYQQIWVSENKAVLYIYEYWHVWTSINNIHGFHRNCANSWVNYSTLAFFLLVLYLDSNLWWLLRVLYRYRKYESTLSDYHSIHTSNSLMVTHSVVRRENRSWSLFTNHAKWRRKTTQLYCFRTSEIQRRAWPFVETVFSQIQVLYR